MFLAVHTRPLTRSVSLFCWDYFSFPSAACLLLKTHTVRTDRASLLLLLLSSLEAKISQIDSFYYPKEGACTHACMHSFRLPGWAGWAGAYAKDGDYISGGPEFRAIQLNRELKAFCHIVFTRFCYQNVQKYMAKNIYEMQKSK